MPDTGIQPLSLISESVVGLLLVRAWLFAACRLADRDPAGVHLHRE